MNTSHQFWQLVHENEQLSIPSSSYSMQLLFIMNDETDPSHNFNHNQICMNQMLMVLSIISEGFLFTNILVGWILFWLWFINVQYSANEQQSVATNHHINSSPSSAAYMGQCFGSALVQIMASRSMFTEPVKTLEHWLRHLDSGLGIDAIYLDFQKAFYSVPHQRLLKKVRSYRVCEQFYNWNK